MPPGDALAMTCSTIYIDLYIFVSSLQRLWNRDWTLRGRSDPGRQDSDIRHERVMQCEISIRNIPTQSAQPLSSIIEDVPESPTRIPPLILVLSLFNPHIPSIPLWSSARLDFLASRSDILHIAPRNDSIP